MSPDGQNESKWFPTGDSLTHFVQKVYIFHKQIKIDLSSLYQLVLIGQNDSR